MSTRQTLRPARSPVRKGARRKADAPNDGRDLRPAILDGLRTVAWLLSIVVAALALLDSCASGKPMLTPMEAKLATLAAPGPYAVARYDVAWKDSARGRTVAARIYAPLDDHQAFPVIVFSHGLGNSREGYSYLGSHWASRGYVSIHPEHVGADVEVTRHGLWHLYRAGFDRATWRSVPEDIRFVIDQIGSDDALPIDLRGKLDRRRIGVAGHSLGAYAALAVGGLAVPLPGEGIVSFRDRRVIAAIPMSMSENLPATAYKSVSIPMLHLTGTRDSSILYGTTQRMRRLPFEAIQRSDQYLLTLTGGNHSTFSDDESPANRAAHDVIRAATTLFWDAYLRGEASALDALRNGRLMEAIGGAGRLEVKR